MEQIQTWGDSSVLVIVTGLPFEHRLEDVHVETVLCSWHTFKQNGRTRELCAHVVLRFADVSVR